MQPPQIRGCGPLVRRSPALRPSAAGIFAVVPALLVAVVARGQVPVPRPATQPAAVRPIAPGQGQVVVPVAGQPPVAGGAQGAAPSSGAAPPQAAGLAAAPPLSPEAAAALDRLLAAWEGRNAAVRTWSCGFWKWEYNAFGPVGPKGDRLAFSESTGEIKYAMPDKGLFRVKESRQWNPQTSRYEARAGDVGEHWVCSGTSIYEFRHTERQLRETRLPPEMRGKAISDGPLPFVFGAKAETLKKRYSMRIITPPGVTDQVWLEALPRYQADAANFSKVELILQTRDLMPFAIRIFKPGGQDHDVFQFDPKTSLVDKGLDLIRDFSKPVTPLGYTFILEDAAGPPPAQQTAGQPAAAPR